MDTQRVSIIPLPIYCVLFVSLGALLAIEKLSSEISIIFGMLAVLSFGCAELGARIPGLRQIGGAVILTVLLPSYLVHRSLLPMQLVQSISDFWQATNILYLFTVAVIVGGILSMDRQLLIKGCAKLFIPLGAGSVAAAVVGTLTGMAFGLSAHHAFFYLVIPIMAGGLGEGAIPLTLGYAAILQVPQAQLFAQVVPPVVLGNLTAIVCAALFHQLGKRYPRCSGDGHLLPITAPVLPLEEKPFTVTVEHVAAAGMIALCLYVAGTVICQFTGLPAPLGMLLLTVLVKLTCVIPPKFEHGAYKMYHFFAVAAAYPILFGIGLILTPWDALVEALTLAHFVTIFVTVVTLTVVGFLVGRWAGLHSVESAIVNACHSGMGSVGDMAILTASHRMQLMPFAQLATRIGGAFTVMLALLVMSQLPPV
ncbi:2-hydroxycarboxylate transporter family protein [Mycoavidus sp. B2-EB]|uniref:2-hydroxycarboxylate transporter family protein n=1 Tax=Mycoavidus sp. B2-EB TaxID=2651972 RepID=UPI001626B737|nr:2-hydroxycarboxylate transporter family protein [Mycoavidus sp. B2-EB]